MKFYRLSGATFCDYVITIYQFIKPVLDENMTTFEEYGAFNLENVGVYDESAKIKVCQYNFQYISIVLV